MTLDFLAGPIDTLSMASVRSERTIVFPFLLAASKADSLIKFAKSAPENPGVCLAIVPISTCFSIGFPLECTANISFLP